MKKGKIQRKYLCILLVFTMIISGMILTADQNDSIKVCGKSVLSNLSKNGTSINDFNTNSICENQCLNESLGIHEVSSTLCMKKGCEKNIDTQKDLILSFLAVWPVNSVYYLNLEMQQPQIYLCGRNVIIRYIHLKDGEKDKIYYL